MTVAKRVSSARATCQLRKCANRADGVWRLGTAEKPSRFIPLCAACMDELQEQLDRGHADEREVFAVFWDD